MKQQIKKVSRWLFLIILVCFFLPFVTVSCQQKKVVTLSGLQLATGTTIEQPSLIGETPRKQELPPDPLASLSLIAAAFGLGTSFLGGTIGTFSRTGISAAGAILLLLLKSEIDDSVMQQGQGALEVDYGFGFWLSFLLFVATAGLNGSKLMGNKRSNRTLPKKDA